MPPNDLDDPIEDMADSSPAALDDKAEGHEADATTADSSAATDDTSTDTLSVVRDVVDASKAETEEPAPSAEGDEDGEQADGDTKSEQDDPEYSDVPFSKHPRFQQLLRKAKSHEQDAVRYQNVERFLVDNNLSAEEAADVMVIAGLAKTDPPKAFQMAKKWINDLLVGAGEILPQDLAERVTKGEMARDVAIEVSRARAATTAASARQQFEQERGTRQQQTELGRTLKETAETWVNNRRLRDPSFAAKEARIAEKLAFLHNVKKDRPNTVEGVRAQLKRVYDEVNKEIGTVRPAAANQQQQRRPALRPVTGGQVAASTAAPPSGKRSTVDLVKDMVKARAS